MTADFSRLLTEDRRLCLLRILDASPDRKANHFVLQTIVGNLGHAVSRDQVLADIAWLAELALVRAESMHSSEGTITIAHLTGRGEDVAQGRAVVPGIKRPLPGE